MLDVSFSLFWAVSFISLTVFSILVTGNRFPQTIWRDRSLICSCSALYLISEIVIFLSVTYNSIMQLSGCFSGIPRTTIA